MNARSLIKRAEAFRAPLAGTAVLAGLLLFLEPTSFEIRIGGLSVDTWVSDHFYDFTARRWMVDGHEATLRLLFYDGPKIAIIALSVMAVLCGLLPERFWKPAGPAARLFTTRRTAFYLAACLALVPLTCNRLKAVTNIYCPAETTRYGGHAPYVRVWDSYSPDFTTHQRTAHERGRAFPAGHASGGFALMALGYVTTRRRLRIAGWLAGISAGLWMGGYQMLKGAHYLNHTLVTWCIAWLGVTILARVFKPAGFGDNRSAEPETNVSRFVQTDGEFHSHGRGESA